MRDPYVVFPSTVNLWKMLSLVHGLQKPTHAGLEEHVFRTFIHLYEKLEQGKRLVDPGQFHELRYEDLVSDTETHARRLMEFLQLPWNDNVLAFADHAKSRGFISTPSYSQVVEPVYTRSIGRWRHYAAHFAEAEAILAPYLKHWGYEPATR